MGAGASAALALTTLARPAWAQTYGVNSITSATPNLGEVVSAPTGDTTFTIDTGGVVSPPNGGGLRLTMGSSQTSVVIRCSGSGCAGRGTEAQVSIIPTGTPSGRARAMANFTTDLTALSTHRSGSTLTQVIAGFSGTMTFHVGMDFGVAGDNSGLASNKATSNFEVLIGPYPGSATASRVSTGGTVTAYRPISMTKVSDLRFGAIVPPKSGSAFVSIDKTSGALSAGTGALLPGGSTGYASFLLKGEANEHATVTTDSSLTMTSGGNSLVVTLEPSVTGNKTITGTTGQSGTMLITVGGGFHLAPTQPSGVYSGTFTVQVQYD